MTSIAEVQDEIRKVEVELEELRKRLQEDAEKMLEAEKTHLWKKEELLMKEKELLRQKELLLMQSAATVVIQQHPGHMVVQQQQTGQGNPFSEFPYLMPPNLEEFRAQESPTISCQKEVAAAIVTLPQVEMKDEPVLQLLHKQAVKWRPWSRNASSWAFFTVNDNEPVQLEKPQVLRCILCHPEPINLELLAQRTRARKGVITYNKSNGTTAMRKHIESEHAKVAKTYEAEIENHRLTPRPLGAKKIPSQRRPKSLPLTCTSSPQPTPTTESAVSDCIEP
ncbi:unnamed protein product [Sphagnum troendelagicum]|uniref:Uncharacterized protein n=1 Tax=Sphagnum troendelagicum TaxID=128251 RepID=A0ABP0TBS2_9BRYO